jgi:hypothetical protein
MEENFMYENEFRNKKIPAEDTLKREALKQALDIRKFEIDLYWKRATYFWGFLIVIFAGYFAVLGSEIMVTSKLNMQLIISCIGFLFSVGWFLVNKGSKYWQNNWEKHVDKLENEIMGPLYKTFLVQKKEKKKIAFITEASNFSVSKINQILSFYLLTIWGTLSIFNFVIIINNYLLLLEKDLDKVIIPDLPSEFFNIPIQPIIFFLITLIFLFIIAIEGKAKNYKKSYTIDKDDHFSITQLSQTKLGRYALI